MADTDFHVISGNSSDEEVVAAQQQQQQQSTDEIDSMIDSQIIRSNENKEINIQTINLRQITDLVNSQTMRGYRAGYEDGYTDGTKVNDLFIFGHGFSLGLSFAGAMLMIFNRKW